MLSNRLTDSGRVLIADDDPVIRHLVKCLVENEKYEAVTVKDGREAFRILQSDADFSGAIFDLRMPYLEGVDLIRYMRTEKRLSRIPVMMITSESDLTVVADSFAAGATVFLRKPFTVEQLQATVRLMLGNTNRRKSSPQNLGVLAGPIPHPLHG